MAAFLALLCALALSCKQPATEIIVKIDSDMMAGSELQAVRIVARREGEGAAILDRRYTLLSTTGQSPGADGAAQGYTLPGEVAIYAREPDDPRRLRVSVFAYLRHDTGSGKEASDFVQEASVQFVPAQRVFLVMFLAGRCRLEFNRRLCGPGTTCGREGCIPVEQTGTTTPPPADGSAPVDVPSLLDAPRDQGADAMDAGVDDRPDVADDRRDVQDVTPERAVADVYRGCGTAGATEVCYDGVDNNCNGRIDEGCAVRSCAAMDGGAPRDAGEDADVADPCAQVRIEPVGGTITLGSPDSGVGTLNGVAVSPFVIDRYEVSVARYRAFFRAGMPKPPYDAVQYPGGQLAWAVLFHSYGYTTWTFREPATAATDQYCHWSATPGALEDHPMNCVDWGAAMAFCVWDGGRLPTEAEWEYLARYHPLPGAPAALMATPPRNFPWGNAARDCEHSNYRDPTCIMMPTYPRPPFGTWEFSYGETSWSPVANLAGNLAEWTADAFWTFNSTRCFPQASRLDNPVCTRPDAYNAVVRGGSFESRPGEMPSWARVQHPYEFRVATVGFRCARTP